MNFRLCLGNHSIEALSALGDMALFLKHAVEEHGHGFEIAHDEMTASGLTLLLENFKTPREVEGLRRFRDAGGRIGLIATETITSDSINPFQAGRANSVGADPAEQQRLQAEQRYWENRGRHLRDVAPLTSFVWCLIEASVEPMKQLAGHDRVFFMPFGHVPKYHEIPVIPLAERSYDFSLFGRPTQHRFGIVQALRARGFRVVSPPAMLPRYMRNDMIQRTRINLWARMNPDWSMGSVGRAAHLLTNQAFQLCETADWAYLSPYLALEEPAKFVDTCVAAARAPDFYRAQAQTFERFRVEQTMKPVMGALLEGSLGE